MSFFDKFKPSEMDTFVKTTLKGRKPEPITISISEIDKVYYGIAVPLRKKSGRASGEVVAYIDTHLSGRCPKCDAYIPGSDLTNAASMKDLSGSMIFMGGGGPSQRLVQGLCPNESCSSTEVTLYWAL